MNTSQIVAHNTYKRRTYTRFSQFSIKSLIIQKDLQSRSKHHDNKHHGWHICVYAIHVIDVLLISISLSNHNLACHSLVFFFWLCSRTIMCSQSSQALRLSISISCNATRAVATTLLHTQRITFSISCRFNFLLCSSHSTDPHQFILLRNVPKK